jgi:hypothetical protein
VRRTGASNLSLFHRLGITLVILGMVQSLAPTCFRPTRSSLLLLGRLKVAFGILGSPEVAAHLLLTSPTSPSQLGPDQESNQESHDTEDLGETFAWSEAMTVRRTVQRAAAVAPLLSLSKPGRAVERTQSALQRSRALTVLAATRSATVRFCRLTC